MQDLVPYNGGSFYKPISSGGHDVSGEARDKDGMWTSGGDHSARKQEIKSFGIEIAKYLGLSENDLEQAKTTNSVYIHYKKDGQPYEFRISDHGSNQNRDNIKINEGVKIIELPLIPYAAKQKIDYELNRKEAVGIGGNITHPSYGNGVVTEFDKSKRKLTVKFNDGIHFLDADAIRDRGFIK